MKLPQFEKSWHGIDFSSLPLKLEKGQPANDEFYAAFYAELSKKGVDPNWLAAKRALGDWVEKNILHHRTNPRVLSIAVGLAVAEQDWLSKGYHVALNECQVDSLTEIRARFPYATTLIGNAHELEIPGIYDVITVFTVDYALSDAQLSGMFSRLRDALAEGGIVINQTVNILTCRRILTESIKRWILHRYNKRGWIFWGWNRSAGSVIAIARRAGLDLMSQFTRDEKGFRQRNRILWSLPPLLRPEMLMLFKKAD